MQWVTQFLIQMLRSEVAEPPSNPIQYPESGDLAPANASPNAHCRIASSYEARVALLEHQRKSSIVQRSKCYQYLIACGIALAVLIYLHFPALLLPLWPVILPVVAGIVVFREVLKHEVISRDLDRLLGFYDRRLLRVKHEWMGKGDPGLDLQVDGHLSAADLDLFGKGSLFELLCDVETPSGREALAEWIQNPATPADVLLRQRAITSLLDRTDLREKLAVQREGEASQFSWDSLREWLLANPVSFPRWLPWAAFLLCLSMGIVAMCGIKGLIEPYYVFWAMAAIGTTEVALTLSFRSRVLFVLAGLHLPSRKFEAMRRMCAMLDREPLDSPLLVLMQKRLRGSSECVARLQKLVRLRELRNNEYVCYPLAALLWTTQLTIRIERWRQRYGSELVRWLTVLGEFEALIAITAYAYENPQDPFPELANDGGPRFEATGMGHPLMDVRTNIKNDLKLGDEVQFLLVTGSNMSGKSTLMRAAGVNATLAWMGAPVRATSLRLSPLQVCASIRVDDSLLNGHSHFYAEVARLKAILERAASGLPVFFLIDELFGGTNSADRRVAAESVIRLLVERQAIGLVTSHDLSLAEIPEKHELKGINVHLTDLPSDEGLHFDYRLRPGKVTRSNALKIIKLIGVPLK
jgi:MutS domain V